MADGIDLRGMRILIVDDDDENAELTRSILEDANYRNVSTTRDAEDVPRLCRTDPRPDLLILDLHMPVLDGFGVLSRIQPLLTGSPYLPVIVVTADATREATRRALSLGASDFLTKPVDPAEVLLRTNNLLRGYRLRNHLNDLVERATADVEQARLETLACLATAAEFRDDQTGRHTQRVGHTAGLIAERMGFAEASVQLIRSAAPLHDIGKLGIPDSILLKPGSLTVDETEVMRTHVEIGAQILAAGRSPVLSLAGQIALFHHERWDGNGYLRGLAGEEIPIEARITALADDFDALTHVRPYKPAWTLERAVDELQSERAKHFDPDVVDAFMTLEHKDLVEPSDAIAALPSSMQVTSGP